MVHQKFAKAVFLDLKAKAGALQFISQEERRIERTMASVAQKMGCEFMVWRSSVGMGTLDKPIVDWNRQATSDDPYAAMMQMFNFVKSQTNKPTVYLIEDAGVYLDRDPLAVRLLRDELSVQVGLPRDRERSVVFLDAILPEKSLPGVVRIDVPLPDRKELEAAVDGIMEVRGSTVINGERDIVVDSLTGLELEQASVACSKSLVQTGELDPSVLVESKKALLTDRALSWTEPVPTEHLGGLERMIQWLKDRKTAFSQKARDWGLAPPKAVMIAGVPGSGKSLTSKVLGSGWGMPVLRYDISASLSKYQSESEEGFRRAMNIAKSLAPCILWWDEIEKGLAGAGSDSATSGGTMTRIYGSLLTAMQETEESVFHVFTANNPMALVQSDSALMRRMDQIFWVDTPHCDARVSIVEALKKKYRWAAEIDAEEIANASETYTGAEIEKAMCSASFMAFNDDAEFVSTSLVLSELERITPVVKAFGKSMAGLRSWAKHNAEDADIDGTDETTTERSVDEVKVDDLTFK